MNAAAALSPSRAENIDVAKEMSAGSSANGWSGMLNQVRNAVENVSTIAPQLHTLVKGAALGFAAVGLGASPLARLLAGAGPALTIAGTVCGSMIILAKAYDYLADAVATDASPLWQGMASVAQQYVYHPLQSCLDKVVELLNAGAGAVCELLAASNAEHALMKYLLITFSIF